MCGILGWAGNGTKPFNDCEFESALDLLQHRGPDDKGIWCSDNVMLGHRRLSILDLSSNGHQPMNSYSKNNHIVFNGEIYNYIELRKDLKKNEIIKKEKSDTRVLLELFEEKGLSSLAKLNGMYAFAIWDSVKKRLILCRDRFGVKPLYYRIGKDGIAFSSEPKALLALYPENRIIDNETLLEFLSSNNLYTNNKSFYKGIDILPQGHYAIYDMNNKKFIVDRYWRYPEYNDNKHIIYPEQALEQFTDLLEDSVKIRLRSDVPVGITLSGGLDSTAILTAASKYSKDTIRCYTSVYDKYGIEKISDEYSWAKLATDNVNASLTSVIAKSTEWMEVMKNIMWHMDGPGYSPAVYPLWCLMKKARIDGVPVILEGQGADEALAGYAPYSIIDLITYLKKDGWKNPNELYSRLNGMKKSFSVSWAIAWLLREKYTNLLPIYRRFNGFDSVLRKGIKINDKNNVNYSVEKRLLNDHSRFILPGLLHYGDSISMAHSIEARQPFLDYRLVEWIFNAPTKIKLFQGQTKWILREYLRSNNQNAIGNRFDKKGYPTPTKIWLASKKGREIEEMILKKNSPLYEWCDPDRIKLLFEKNRRGIIGTEFHIYKILSAQIWIDTCI